MPPTLPVDHWYLLNRLDFLTQAVFNYRQKHQFILETDPEILANLDAPTMHDEAFEIALSEISQIRAEAYHYVRFSVPLLPEATDLFTQIVEIINLLNIQRSQQRGILELKRLALL